MKVNNRGFLKIFFVIILVIAAVVYGVIFGQRYIENEKDKPVISDFDDCLSAGLAVMESYPRKCQAEDGSMFTEDIGNALAKEDLIRLDLPRPNQGISNPLVLEGQARGYWFFEGDFPVVVLYKGQVIAEGIATAQSDWMTEDFVEFKAELEYQGPTEGKGTLVLKKDNPSGLPANADELTVPIIFE
ncbi:hypothetical protein HOB10_01635 [Candidatus Parcubacteria bacterium]|jgi:hypothetical protein|nr:hypothetical protein [Candidatus Parcubacteria bacterium]